MENVMKRSSVASLESCCWLLGELKKATVKEIRTTSFLLHRSQNKTSGNLFVCFIQNLIKCMDSHTEVFLSVNCDLLRRDGPAWLEDI